MEFQNLGGQERPVDKRDFGLATYQKPVALPESYKSDLNIQVYYQGKYGTCGAHAGATFTSGVYQKALSPKYLWKQIKLIDGFSVEDGTDMRSIFKSLSNTGDCTIELCPNDLGASITDYTDPSQITDDQRADAWKHDITGYAFTDNPSWEDIKQTIYQNKYAIALVKCGDGWWKDKNGVNSWAEKDVLPLKLGNYVSGHFVLLYGFDKDFIYFRNSWGTDWGQGGNGYFDQSFLPNVREIGTAIALQPYVFKKNLWMGQKNADVTELQNRLGVSPATGYFGAKTLAAVVKYQKSQGITPTGFVGTLTRASLNKL